MTSFRSPDAADARLMRLEEQLAGLRERIAELVQHDIRDEREMAALDERLRDAEGNAVSLASEVSSLSRAIDEIQTLRERLGRFQSALGEGQEQLDVVIRRLRQELEAERDQLGDADRRLQSLEAGTNELRDRLTTFDDAQRRTNTESAETAHRLSQIENTLEALGARISANAEAIRRTTTENRTIENRIEGLERQLREYNERQEMANQAVRRVTESSERWDDLATAVEGMRSRVDDALRVLDEAKSVAASVRRGYEALDERIGNIERSAEQLRARDARRERAVAELDDKITGLTDLAAQDQDRFITLQEQIRRRQIDDLEQEIRTLKAYMRVRSDA